MAQKSKSMNEFHNAAVTSNDGTPTRDVTDLSKIRIRRIRIFPAKSVGFPIRISEMT
jgi:hypothetical protein